MLQEISALPSNSTPEYSTMKVCAIVFSQHRYELTSFSQFATLILAALVAVATASIVEVRAPVAALDLEERVRICLL